MKKLLPLATVFLAALLFGLGLGIGGMTLPTKIIGFLDVTGAWDPSLAFVMMGAVGTHALAYRLIVKRPSPLLEPSFQIPTKRAIDRRLIVGSFLFGAGWGLGGFCPGPAIVASVSGNLSVLTFVLSMIAGIYLYKGVEGMRRRREEGKDGN